MQTFKLVTEFQTLTRRSFPLTDPTLLRPQTSANPILMGEWLELDTAYKMARGASVADPALVPSFPYFAEEGQYEVQAIDKGPFLFLGSFEADTKVFADAAISTVGQLLYVADVDVGGLTKRGLIGDGAPPTGAVPIGYVTRLPADNKGWLRFIRSLA
jgi:hypothetical protein